VTFDGTTITLAGNGTFGFFDGSGGADGTSELATPQGVAAGTGFVYVGDTANNRVRLAGCTSRFFVSDKANNAIRVIQQP